MKVLILIVLLLSLSIWSLFVGISSISLTSLLNGSDDALFVMVVSRVPRTLAIIIAGSCMSICGLIMQQLAQNKFVSPTTAGTMDAAALGIMVAMVLLPNGGLLGKVVISFGFTLAATAFFMIMINRIKFKNIIFVPLLGIIFGNILDSITTFFGLQFNIVQNMASWLQGDFSAVMQGNYELIYISIPLVFISYIYASQFTIVGMGESFAVNLGLRYRRMFNLGLAIVAIVTSVIVLTVGMIPFLGLIVPNIVSILFGDNLKKTLPLTALAGAVFLLACDIAGRLIIFPFEIAISVMVGIIGGAVFLYMLLGRRLHA